MYKVYLCKCNYPDEPEKYYIGYTNDFTRRMNEHWKEMEFKRQGWFRQHKMEGFEAIVITECSERAAAMQLEKRFKNIPREQKQKIFNSYYQSRGRGLEFLRSTTPNN